MERHSWTSAGDWDNNQSEQLVEHAGFNPAAIKPTPLPVEDLAAYWRFDGDGSGGTIPDTSPNDNVGTVQNGTSFKNSGPECVGDSVHLQGGEITFQKTESLTAALGSAPVTLGFWYKANTNDNDWSRLFSWTAENDAGAQNVRVEEQGASITPYTRWIVDPASDGLNTSDGGTWARSKMGYSLGEWHFHVSTFDGETFTNYQDGEVNDTTNRNATLAPVTAGFNLDVGEDCNIAEFFIAEDRAFSASKVSEIYSSYVNGWTGSITTSERE